MILDSLVGKTAVILSGVPGCGKSTIAKWLKLKYDAVSVSADDHFVVGGVYTFNGSLLGAAHGACKAKYAAWCKSSADNICVVDNTNLTYGELRYYLDIAREHNVTTVIVSVATQANMARSLHGLTPEAMNRMVAKRESGLRELSNLAEFNTVDQSVVDELYNQLQKETE